MLDNSITLFSLQKPNIEVKNKALVMSGCNAILFDDKMAYSELDELSFSNINNNDYGYWSMNIEFCFENNFDNPYFSFFAGCFAIRSDNGIRIKLDGNPYNECYSKVNKNNKVVAGILYYFKSEEEKDNIQNCSMLCVEGCIAINKKNNIYDVMCRFIKINNEWKLADANTLRIHKKGSIVNMRH